MTCDDPAFSEFAHGRRLCDRHTSRPRLAVFKFASCDGCQLSLLDCEDELLAVAECRGDRVLPGGQQSDGTGPYDVALVEGSITTPHDAERIQEVRRNPAPS